MLSNTNKQIGAVIRQKKSGQHLNDKIVEAMSWDGERTRSEALGARGAGRLIAKVLKSHDKEFRFKYYQSSTRPVEITIGRFRPPRSKTKAGLSVSEARAKALEYSSLLLKGEDPKIWLAEQALQDKKKQQEHEAQKNIGTLGELLALYVNQLKNDGKKTWEQVKKQLKSHVTKPFPQYCALPAKDIAPEDIVTILRRLHNKGTQTALRHIRAYLHAAFANGLGAHLDPASAVHSEDNNQRHFHLTSNPVASVKSNASKMRIGERHLSEQELADAWNKWPHYMSEDMALLFRFLIALGGQRPLEILQAQWSCYDEEEALLQLPGDIVKNGQDHTVPLNKHALSILKQLKGRNEECPYPFPAAKLADRQTNHIRLDSVSQAMDRFCAASGMDKFTPKDLRRTCKTLMAKNGFSKDLMQQLHNHAKQGVDDIHYNKYSYLDEKREALNGWAEVLDDILFEE